MCKHKCFIEKSFFLCLTSADDLGRVVIPKEIRRTMRIREGTPLEIFTGKDGEVIFKKYSLMDNVNEFAGQLCETLYKTTGHPVFITDLDSVIAVAGLPKKDWIDQRISRQLESVIENRRLYQHEEEKAPFPILDSQQTVLVYMAAPILTEGDTMGCVVFGGRSDGQPMGEVEEKLLQTVSGFLGRHMET